jgi:hypothetical protein
MARPAPARIAPHRNLAGRPGRDFLRAEVYIEQSTAPRFPDVAMDDLRAAWADVLKRAKLVQHHKISREELSVREHMSSILRRLQSVRFVEFSELFDVTRGVPVVVVNFIAMLELARQAHQRQMAFMQIAHRRDEGGTVLAAQLIAQFLDRADDFHDEELRRATPCGWKARRL